MPYAIRWREKLHKKNTGLAGPLPTLKDWDPEWRECQQVKVYPALWMAEAVARRVSTRFKHLEFTPEEYDRPI